MKRSKLLLIVTFSIIALLTVGCNKEKKLVCTQKTNDVDIEFNVGFKGNIIDTMDFNYNLDLSKYSDTQIKYIEKQDFCSLVKKSMSTYKNAFTDCKQEITNKNLKVSSVLDVDKVAKSTTDKMSSVKSTKTELEKQGYKCTIK